MFRAAHHSSSGAPKFTCSLWFICPYGDQPLPKLGGYWVPTQPWQRPVTIWAYTPEAASTVWSSWWWEVCCSKYVKHLKNFVIINSITKLHVDGISTEKNVTHNGLWKWQCSVHISCIFLSPALALKKVAVNTFLSIAYQSIILRVT